MVRCLGIVSAGAVAQMPLLLHPQCFPERFIPAGIVGDSPLREGVVSGFLLIFFSEIGDKTFFIALLLALKQPKSLVFTGTFGALAIMTVISVLLGQVRRGWASRWVGIWLTETYRGFSFFT